jgi:hypothetical protein
MNTLGKIALILSLLCFLVTLGFKLALQGWIPFIGWGLGFAAFFFVFALVINFKYLLILIRSESLQFLGKSALLLTLVILILAVSNFIFHKQNWTVDLTRNQIHSLSNFTQVLLKAIPEPLGFHYFHTDNAQVRGYEPRVREFLAPYLRLNPQLQYQSHSIFKNPELAKKFKTGNEESLLFVEFKDRIARVSALTEPAVTNAILKVSKAPKKIYFVSGHGERQLEDDSTFGLSGVKVQLERLHYELEALEDLTQLPDDIALLVVVGPEQAFSDAELSQLRQHLQQGGALLIAADPGEAHNVNALTQDYGLTLEERFVFSDQAQSGQSKLLVLTHNANLEHAVAQSLNQGDNPILFISSALSLNPEVNPSVRLSPVLEHLPNSVGRADLDESSAIVGQGRQVAAAVAEGTGESRFRLALIADSDFLTNQFYAQPSNFNLLLGFMTFLSQDEDLLRMRPPQPETTYLIVTGTNLNLYFLFLILPYCLIFFVLALFFKLRRFF